MPWKKSLIHRARCLVLCVLCLAGCEPVDAVDEKTDSPNSAAPKAIIARFDHSARPTRSCQMGVEYVVAWLQSQVNISW